MFFLQYSNKTAVKLENFSKFHSNSSFKSLKNLTELLSTSRIFFFFFFQFPGIFFNSITNFYCFYVYLFRWHHRDYIKCLITNFNQFSVHLRSINKPQSICPSTWNIFFSSLSIFNERKIPNNWSRNLISH